MNKPVIYVAKIFWPDCLDTFKDTSFEKLGAAVGAHLDREFRMAPLKVEFSIEYE